LGVITYQLLSGRTPFESRNPKKIDYNIKHKKILFENTEHENWSDISESAKEFIKACLCRNQEKRPSINELFQMKWIQDYYNKQLEKPLEQETDRAIQRSIQKNMINFSELNQF
jgi:serine/threonine protein kinase